MSESFSKWYAENKTTLLRKRREKYHANKAYRKYVRELVKSGSAYNSNRTLREFPIIDDVTSHGSSRLVLVNGKQVYKVCFTVTDLAEMLGFARQTILKWIRQGRIPEPSLEVVKGTNYDKISETYAYDLTKIKKFVKYLNDNFGGKRVGAVFTNSDVVEEINEIFQK